MTEGGGGATRAEGPGSDSGSWNQGRIVSWQLDPGGRQTQQSPGMLSRQRVKRRTSLASPLLTTTKAGGGDGIPGELFKILKDDAVKVLHSTCKQIWKTQQWPQDWKKSVFIPVPKKGSAKGCSKYHTIVLISHASKVMLKILQVRLQQYVNQELMFKLDLEKAEDPEIKLPTFIGSQKKWEFQGNIYFCSTDYTKAFDCVDHNKLWKIIKDVGIPDYLTCLLRNLYAGQEATIRTGHGITDWFKIGKGVCQGCILSPCLFNFYVEYIMRNAGLDEVQTGIKIAGRNFNNLRYADYNILWQKVKRN